MGASASVSSVDIVNKAITDISNEVTSELNFNLQSSINNIITADGNIIVSGVENLNYSDSQLQQIFSKLNEKSFNDKVNQQIQQLAESLVKGLNIGNLSVSTSVLRSVIENIIKIKDSALATCSSKQTYEINNIFTSKKDIEVLQTKNFNVAKNIVSCISDNKSNTDIVRKTDLMIKQLSQSKTEGLDINTMIIGVLAVTGVIGLTGATVLSSFIGPIMIIGGGYFAYTEYEKENKTFFNNQLLYLKNDLETYDKQILFLNQKKKTDTDDLEKEYGKADIYEFFQNNVKSYKWDQPKEINLNSDIEVDDLTFNKIGNNSISMAVKNSEKYIKRFTFKNFVSDSNIKIVKDLPDNNQYNENDVKILANNFKYTHSILISQFVKKNEKLVEEPLDHYDLEPTILSVKKQKTGNITSNPIFLGSLAVSAIGLILTIKNSFNSKNSFDSKK